MKGEQKRMRLFHNKHGYWYFGVGSLLMFLVVLFILIDSFSPESGNSIADSIRQLFGSISG